MWSSSGVYLRSTTVFNIYKRPTYLNDDLKTLQNWLNLNKLSLNAIKTKCMFIASRQLGLKLDELEFDMGASCFYYNLQSLQGD